MPIKTKNEIKLEKRCRRLERIVRHAYPEVSGQYFICGESGDKDQNGLPDSILVCSTYGSDIVEIYARQTKQ